LIVCSSFLSKISCVGFFSSVIWAFLSFVLPIVLLENGDRTNVTQYINMISIFRAVRFVSVVQTRTKFAQQKVFTELNNLKNEIGVNLVRGPLLLVFTSLSKMQLIMKQEWQSWQRLVSLERSFHLTDEYE
jgi:DMSO/TMAO reductase YedYZ heme-binding membrane subunit